jgi:hypothetical protein
MNLKVIDDQLNFLVTHNTFLKLLTRSSAIDHSFIKQFQDIAKSTDLTIGYQPLMIFIGE